MKSIKLKISGCGFLFFAIILLFAGNSLESYAQTTKSSEKTADCKKNGKKSSKNKKKEEPKKQMNKTNLLPVEPSIWGTTGINLTIQDDGAKIEYDCAGGEITQKFTINDDGNFTLDGKYTAQTPGPVVLNRQPVDRDARFEGKIFDGQMLLKVTFLDNNEKLEDVLLKRDVTGRIRHCY